MVVSGFFAKCVLGRTTTKQWSYFGGSQLSSVELQLKAIQFLRLEQDRLIK